MSIIRNLDSSKVWDYENGFYWFSGVSRIGKLLAHEKLYSRIVNLPGDICEFGVYKACSLLRFASFRELFESQSSRRIIGFDAFGEFPTENVRSKEDVDFVGRFESEGGDGLSVDEAESLLELKGIGNVELIKGDVFDTLPTYLKINPSLRICLLHLDMDVKEPTEYVLHELYDRVVKGGLVVIDDYNAVYGASEVTDRFCNQHGLTLHKLPYSRTPSYFVKP